VLEVTSRPKTCRSVHEMAARRGEGTMLLTGGGIAPRPEYGGDVIWLTVVTAFDPDMIAETFLAQHKQARED
jgi:hypothetical protein